jgi:uncharacterized damage-inducible protein DinB
MSDDLGKIAIKGFHDRLCVDYAKQIRACVAELNDEQIWWRPNPTSNSIGNLIFHLCGNLRHFIIKGVGGRPYDRDRNSEFSEQGPIPKDELLAKFKSVIDDVAAVFSELKPERLTEHNDQTEMHMTNYLLIMYMTMHFGLHTGQVIYITKMLKEGIFADADYKPQAAPRGAALQ